MIKVMKFWAEWCRPCLDYAPKFHAAMLSTGAFHEEIDTDKHPDIAQEYGITNLPTTLILCDDKVVTRLTGIVEADALEQAIEGAIQVC